MTQGPGPFSRSYVATEQAKRSELGLDEDATTLQLPDNTNLAESGKEEEYLNYWPLGNTAVILS